MAQFSGARTAKMIHRVIYPVPHYQVSKQRTAEISKDLKRQDLLGMYTFMFEPVETPNGLKNFRAYYFSQEDTAFYFRIRWT